MWNISEHSEAKGENDQIPNLDSHNQKVNYSTLYSC